MTGYAIPIGGGLTFTARQDRQSGTGLMTPGATGLQVTPGVRPGPGLDVTVVGSTITVTPGAAAVQSASSAVAGAYRAFLDANFTATLTAADASNPRVDLVYLRVRDTDEDGSGARDCTPVYVTGTPAASPITPTIPGGASGIVLATISVPKSGGGAPTVSYAGRQITAAAGGIPPVNSGLLSVPGLYVGQARYNVVRGCPEYWNGSAWTAQGDSTSFTPVFTSLGGGAAIGNGVITSRWTRIGGQVFWGGQFTIGSTTAGGTGLWFISMPVPQAAGFTRLGNFNLIAGGNNYVGTVSCNPADGGKATLIAKSPFSNVSADAVSAIVPVPMAAGNVLIWNASFEAA
ncbi:hypothetical protein ACIQC7_27995 [Kitasatospora sp. NPDC088556]|uniref:hypothetical protein n=1 Tax=Kitasatospora sp. NPDC088556 TaxID=3364076 RepID=UPI003818AC92